MVTEKAVKLLCIGYSYSDTLPGRTSEKVGSGAYDRTQPSALGSHDIPTKQRMIRLLVKLVEIC